MCVRMCFGFDGLRQALTVWLLLCGRSGPIGVVVLWCVFRMGFRCVLW